MANWNEPLHDGDFVPRQQPIAAIPRLTSALRALIVRCEEEITAERMGEPTANVAVAWQNLWAAVPAQVSRSSALLAMAHALQVRGVIRPIGLIAWLEVVDECVQFVQSEWSSGPADDEASILDEMAAAFEASVTGKMFTRTATVEGLRAAFRAVEGRRAAHPDGEGPHED